MFPIPRTADPFIESGYFCAMPEQSPQLESGNLTISRHDKVAVLLGASGLVGGYCLDFLLADANYHSVISVGRKKIGKQHPKLRQHIIDFENPETFNQLLKGDDMFICLGTTRARAGSKEAFYRVDYEYVFNCAKVASLNGINQLLLVSSVGANPDSMFFYLKVKGSIEEAVSKLPFWSVHIFRPSVLLGERNENRFGEDIAKRLGKGFDWLLGGALTKFKPVEAEVVARAMVSAAQGLTEGRFNYPSSYLQEVADRYYAKKKLINRKE